MEPHKHSKSGSVLSPSNVWQFCLLAASSGVYVSIILYARSTDRAEAASEAGRPLTPFLKVGVGTTLTVVRVLQGILSAASAVALTRAMASLQWGLMAKPGGIPFRSLLALSTSTLDYGTARIIFSRSSEFVTRLEGAGRVLMVLLIWLSGIVLFIRTTVVTVLDPSSSYPAIAGIGPFNGSYVAPFLEFLHDTAPNYPYDILPYSYYGAIYSLVTNPVFSTIADPIDCDLKQSPDSLNCSSYILSGGLSLSAPPPPNKAAYPMVRLANIPSVQVNFQGREGGIAFEQSDCQVLGANNSLIAVEFCVSQVNPGSIHAGVFVCPNGPQEDCTGSVSRPNMTTTITFYKRRATVIVSRSNLTITSISSLSAPDHINDIDLPAYRAALTWLLDYPAADIPAPSSILQTFFSARQDLDDPFVDGVILQTLRSILAFPVWLFNANNFGNSERGGDKIYGPGLPDEFYIDATPVAPYVKLKFDPVFLWLFSGMHGAALVVLWVLFFWAVVSTRALPAISSYPLFDIFFKSEIGGNIPASEASIPLAGDRRVLELTKDATVHAKVIESGFRAI